jgi:hypothetical protein
MVRFLIEIESGADDPKGVNILLKTERRQPTEVEETDAQQLLPALRDLLKKRFAESDESQ